jgi:hypothetical protein
MVRRVPADEAATEAEVAEAIRGLSAPALVKLERYARYRVWRVGPGAARGRTDGDLLGAALTETLEGTRRWRKDTVDFVTHLIGVMRSLSSHWFDEKEIPEAAFHPDANTEDWSSPHENAAAPVPDIDTVLDAQVRLAEIDTLFAGDMLATEVLGGMRSGLSGPEIQEVLDLSQTQYETVMKRIRRGIDKAFPGARRHGK